MVVPGRIGIPTPARDNAANDNTQTCGREAPSRNEGCSSPEGRSVAA